MYGLAVFSDREVNNFENLFKLFFIFFTVRNKAAGVRLACAMSGAPVWGDHIWRETVSGRNPRENG